MSPYFRPSACSDRRAEHPRCDRRLSRAVQQLSTWWLRLRRDGLRGLDRRAFLLDLSDVPFAHMAIATDFLWQ